MGPAMTVPCSGEEGWSSSSSSSSSSSRSSRLPGEVIGVQP